ncbi:hypothetical protein BDZ97DRAFT_1837297 [Flammula alnicola]|nr:hypothetical protein BDZ97DRAFT_1837297 [Flammula alnicola]
MMSLLADSGGPITSQDPSIIRQQFIYRLSLSGNLGLGSKNFFKKPTKAKVSSMAGLRASTSRRKVDAAFFCELDYCKAGFTRKNGLLNHYRAHLGIADKECKFCHMFFTTSLRRHEQKCKSNPDNEKDSPAKTVAA